MLYRFPNLDTLRLAITSGAVPDAVSRAGARAAFDPDGAVRVQCDARLSAAGRLALGRLGVQIDEAAVDELSETVLCWPQLLPVQPGPQPEFSDRLPVLFELEQVEELPGVVSEMLRLGNDRQAVRWVGDGERTRALLRVVGPPYYTLLRALERQKNGSPLRAYVEQGDRVWVEVGTVHPLGRRLKLPAGKTLLLRAPREWELIEDGRFQDVYSVLEFALPDAPAVWQPVESQTKIRVPLRLAPSDSTEPAELWVLKGNALAQVEQFVQSADEALLARLSFAIGTEGDEATVVLRARPGKSGPPVLVLDGTDYRPVLKLPNLFAPCTARLHPPLRREVVKQLLAEDPLAIVWLELKEQGGFRPRSLPDAAFRPLSDWVEYALDQAQQPLAEWMASLQFDFEPFICREEGDRSRPHDPARPKDDFHPEEDVAVEPEPAVPQVPVKAKKAAPKRTPASQASFQVKPNELRQKLHALEQEFRGLGSPLEAGPQHRELWQRMAQLNAALDRTHDAAVCAGNALWLAGEAPPSAFWNWSPEVARFSSGQATDVGEWLDRILTEPSPSVADMNRLVALLAWSEAASAPLPELRDRLGAVQQFLERNEAHVGVRLLWLAWRAAFRQSQNDVLMLARARDRILERLYHHGLSPDLDLPSFLRFSGSALTDRLRVVREHVLHLRKVVGEWCARTPKPADTLAYVDFLFAWALARLGETTETRRLQDRADRALLRSDRDVVHTWLGLAFVYRIDQALEGKSGGPLPEDLMVRLPQMEKMPRYKVDRLRERSRVLEPVERLDPYRYIRHGTEQERELTLLGDLLNRNELERRLQQFLSYENPRPGDEARIVSTALDLAPRLGEAFAAPVLERVPPLLDRGLAPVERVAVLEKGLFVAAHFDHPELVQDLVNRLQALLGEDLGKEVERTVSTLVQRSFVGLRKLGMRERIAQMLDVIAARARKMPVPPAGPLTENDDQRILPLKLLLQVAAGWFYFGQNELARPVFDEARGVLFSHTLSKRLQTDLACAYVSALGSAPIEVAVGRMVELFQELEGLDDPFTSNSHYYTYVFSVVEAAILALVSDDVAVDKSGRRWLDDDEYLVRKRIHADVRIAITTAEEP